MATGTQMAAKEPIRCATLKSRLSTGKLLGMFFALAIVCGVFFTMGYLLGKSTSAGGRTEIVATVPSSSAGKPYAGNKTPEAVTQTCPPGSPNCAACCGRLTQAHPPSLLISNPRPSNLLAARHQIKAPRNLREQMVKLALQALLWCRWQPYRSRKMLRSWLRRCAKSSIQSSSPMQPAIPLFHVQVGPFTDRKDAEAMRTRLSGDGYNAIVK